VDDGQAFILLSPSFPPPPRRPPPLTRVSLCGRDIFRFSFRLHSSVSEKAKNGAKSGSSSSNSRNSNRIDRLLHFSASPFASLAYRVFARLPLKRPTQTPELHERPNKEAKKRGVAEEDA